MTSLHLFLAAGSFVAGLWAGWAGAMQYMNYQAAADLKLEDWDVHP